MTRRGRASTLGVMGTATRARSSVLDHRFGAGAPFTVGVEEEYMLLDGETLELVQRVEPLLAAEAGGEFAEFIVPEIFESALEAHTCVCESVPDVGVELRRLRSHVAETAGAQGLRVGSASTHPFSLFERQRVTARERYLGIVQELQYAARRELIFGLHVHVAVPDAECSIAVMRGLLDHLCELVALSANGPFWRGQPTGLESVRHAIFSAFPRAGVPPAFRDYKEFASVVGELEAAGFLEDYTQLWWDLRPHPRLGTVEIRAMDAVTSVEDAIAITAYVQALVRLYAERHAAGEPIEAPHPLLVQEDKWRAARYGLGAQVLSRGNGRHVAVATRVRRTLKLLEPHARALGCERELGGIRRLLHDGNGASRQLRVYRVNHDVADVTRDIAARTAP
jgi:glutamate---cysteine ligase / carboxylate-amine ligase